MAVDHRRSEQAEVVDTDGLVAVANRLATECLSPRAAHYDSEAIHPVESWRDVWRQGMLAMGIPRRFGGLELDMLTYIKIVEQLASGCTNTGMTATCTRQ